MIKMDNNNYRVKFINTYLKNDKFFKYTSNRFDNIKKTTNTTNTNNIKENENK